MKTIFDGKLLLIDSTRTMYEIPYEGRTRAQIKESITEQILLVVNRTMDRCQIDEHVIFHNAEDVDAGLDKLAELGYWSDPEA